MGSAPIGSSPNRTGRIDHQSSCDNQAIAELYSPTPTPTPTPTPNPTPIPGGCYGYPDWGQYPTTGCASGFSVSGGVCSRSTAFMNNCNRFGGYDTESCNCFGGCENGGSCSPIVVDISGDGFSMTNAQNGVQFDIDNDGSNETLAWTKVDSDDAWLVFDRNGDGTITGGRELFGNATPQPPPLDGEELNGFLALAEFDKTYNGGNEDVKINRQDMMFAFLRLWKDTNHNGISEAGELHTLDDLDVRAIDLDHRQSRRTDERTRQPIQISGEGQRPAKRERRAMGVGRFFSF